MAIVTSNEYDHIDVVNGSNTNRHYIKDTTARNDIQDLKSAMPYSTYGIVPLPGTWVIGGVYQNTGLPRTDVKYRVMTPDIVTITAANAGTYIVSRGYKLRYWKFVSGSLSGSMVVCDGYITLTAGDSYRFEIRANPEDSTVVLTGVSDMLYKVRKDSPVNYTRLNGKSQNLANGNYTASGGTLNGDTVTVTAAYQGMLSNEFILNNSKFRVKANATFNVTPKCLLRLQYYTTSWQTVSILDLTSDTNAEATVDVSSYTTATKYRILFQNNGVTSGVTNTIKVNSLEIYDLYPAQESSHYSEDFETMLSNIFEGIDRDKIYTCLKATDPNAPGDFDSFVTAVQTLTQKMDAHLFVGAGEWDIISEFGSTYMNSVSSSSSTWGLVLKNRIHIVGSSRAVIKAENDVSSVSNWDELDFSNDSGLPQPALICKYFSVFNAGQHGFTIENLNIVDDYIRYTIHDDLGNAGPTPYHNRYINCRMKHTNGMYPDCIGAGIGEDCYVEIRGCHFDGDVTRNGSPTTRYVYYHGNNNSSVTDAKATIIVADNYFANSGTFKLTNYGNSAAPSGIAYVSNNSFGSEPEVTNGSSVPVPDNMVMYKWNNTVRT